MRLYKSYLFRTKDPAIDELRTVLEDHFGKRVNRKICKQVEELGGPSISTMVGWFFGKTRRPQNPTIEAAGRAAGYRRKWIRIQVKARRG